MCEVEIVGNLPCSSGAKSCKSDVAGAGSSMVVCSFAGGGVGKLEREPQDAKYRSNSSSVMSLVIEKAGESSILKMRVVVVFVIFVVLVLFVICFDVCEFRASCTAMVDVVLLE